MIGSPIVPQPEAIVQPRHQSPVLCDEFTLAVFEQKRLTMPAPRRTGRPRMLGGNMPKIETVRFDGPTISEVRKKFRQWYEDNRAKISIDNEHDIERLQPAPLPGERQHQLHGHGHQDGFTILVEYELRRG